MTECSHAKRHQPGRRYEAPHVPQVDWTLSKLPRQRATQVALEIRVIGHHDFCSGHTIHEDYTPTPCSSRFSSV